jgi:hypothetical protein
MRAKPASRRGVCHENASHCKPLSACTPCLGPGAAWTGVSTLASLAARRGYPRPLDHRSRDLILKNRAARIPARPTWPRGEGPASSSQVAGASSSPAWAIVGRLSGRKARRETFRVRRHGPQSRRAPRRIPGGGWEPGRHALRGMAPSSPGNPARRRGRPRMDFHLHVSGEIVLQLVTLIFTGLVTIRKRK